MKNTIFTDLWSRLPVMLRAIIVGILIAMIAANIWPLLLFNLGAPLAAVVETVFLVAYFWWASGKGPPRGLREVRVTSFRRKRLSKYQWTWGLIAAVAFAATVHASIVVLFRLVPFPAAAFHAGYDFSFIPSVPGRWLAVVVSAASAGVCEETGFRGYMQQPIEKRYGAVTGILISTLFFTSIHLTKDWAIIGMVPIVFGAGVLLGSLAWASQSLIPTMIGHFVMDVGLFGYWWTGVAGTFAQRPISETGMDASFFIECAFFVVVLTITLIGIVKLRATTNSSEPAADLRAA